MLEIIKSPYILYALFTLYIISHIIYIVNINILFLFAQYLTSKRAEIKPPNENLPVHSLTHHRKFQYSA